MSPLFGPILAQLVTLAVADRTEARYIIADDRYAEAATFPHVALNFGWQHATLSLGYGPSITVTPLEAKDPSVLVFHSGAVSSSYRWARTTLTASESIGYGMVNFRVQALADPRTGPVTVAPGVGTGAPTGGTVTPPATGGTTGGPTGTGTAPAGQNGTTANQFRAAGNVRLGTSVTSIGVSQLVSPVLTVSGALSYVVTGAVGSDQGNAYPTVKGPGLQVVAAYRVTHFDTVTASATAQYAASSNGNDASVLLANETWTHQLDRRTTTSLGGGLSITRNSQSDGLIYYSVYPNFLAGITHSSPIGRSTLTFGLSAGSAPFIDPVLAAVDPRLSASAFVGWSKDRFASSLTTGSAVSLASHGDNGALNGVYAAFNMSYLLGASLSIDSGVRAFWQSFAGRTTIPPSAAAYVGITVGGQAPLNH